MSMESLLASLRSWFVQVHPSVTGAADRARAELLGWIMVGIVPLGLAVALAQLVLVEGYSAIFVVVVGAVGLFVLASWLHRTRYWRVGGTLASAVPIVACGAVGILVPDDPAWYGFVLIGVLLATVLLRTQGAALVALFAIAQTVGILVYGGADVDLIAPVGAMQVVFSALLLIASWHRGLVEDARVAELASQQAQLAEATRLELLGRLAGGIAHDFNNLLTVVIANAEMMIDDGDDRPETEQIRDTGHRAAGVVRQLLAFARRQDLRPVVVDLSEQVRALESLLRQAAGGRLHIEIVSTPEPLPVRVDCTQLERAVVNLVVNARDAMPESGTIRVGASRHDQGARAVLEITDDGPGIAPDVVPHIFEPFFTTRGMEGTGLGLATVQGFVAQSGGEISVASTLQVGTTFRIELPLVESDPC